MFVRRHGLNNHAEKFALFLNDTVVADLVAVGNAIVCRS